MIEYTSLQNLTHEKIIFIYKYDYNTIDIIIKNSPYVITIYMRWKNGVSIFNPVWRINEKLKIDRLKKNAMTKILKYNEQNYSKIINYLKEPYAPKCPV